MSYEDTGQFEAVVGQLADPLNDPLPGRPPAVPDSAEQQQRPRPYEPAAEPAPEAPAPEAPEPPVAEPVSRGKHASRPPQPEVRPEPAARRPEPSGHPQAARRPGYEDEAPAATHASPWFRAPEMDHTAAPEQVRAPEPPEHPEPVRAPEAASAGGTAAQAPLAPSGRPERSETSAVDALDAAGAAGAMDPTTATTATTPTAGAHAAAALDVDATAQLPVVDEAQLAGAAFAPATPAPAPGDGGRAARRKAAQRGGGHRARSRTAAAPTAAAGTSPPAPPLSRVEARKAAKAAKDSPAVVISRIVGEVFITTGVIMLLFVTYQLWWTNVRAHQQANSASNSLEHQWAKTAQGPDRNPGTFSPGQGFAIMYIPKLDVKAPIAQGVDKHKVLDKGMVGHYDGSLNTAMPWDKTGNFAVAAHRNTHGEPFRYINHLEAGDKVVVETADAYYTYQVTSSLASTPPTDTSVLQPVPPGSGFTKPGRYITLTTCTPEFTSENRLIVWGKLIEERPRSKGKPDALLQG
ncbi:class E sortase [Streptomyces sp. V4-01]|uniref:Class E sortase n=1 Tax=Actinacidiphila polyblastidii TaxID=3110430 RepID=A0ABU7PHW3_9ACTN|nr:class E sortase [Streptomyces sp. V4-01]